MKNQIKNRIQTLKLICLLIITIVIFSKNDLFAQPPSPILVSPANGTSSVDPLTFSIDYDGHVEAVYFRISPDQKLERENLCIEFSYSAKTYTISNQAWNDESIIYTGKTMYWTAKIKKNGIYSDYANGRSFTKKGNSPPSLKLNKTSINISTTVSSSIEVQNIGETEGLTWWIDSKDSWIGVNLENGYLSPGQNKIIEVQAISEPISSSGFIRFSASTDQSASVSVLYLNDKPRLSLNKSSIFFEKDKSSDIIELLNEGGASLHYTIENLSDTWFEVTPSSGNIAPGRTSLLNINTKEAKNNIGQFNIRSVEEGKTFSVSVQVFDGNKLGNSFTYYINSKPYLEIKIKDPNSTFLPIPNEENKIEVDNTLILNNFVEFKGKLIVDTISCKLQANGILSIIANDFVLYEGVFSTNEIFGSDESILVNSINENLENVELFGTKFKLKSFKFSGDFFNPDGITFDAEINFPQINGTCNEDADMEGSVIGIDGIKVSMDGKISLDEVHLQNLGLPMKGFCLEELNLSYNQGQDVLSAEGSILGGNLFKKLQAGFVSEGGNIRKVTAGLELNKSILLGYNVGFLGGLINIENIGLDNLKVALDGKFNIFSFPQLIETTASGVYEAPSVISINGKANFLNLGDNNWSINDASMGLLIDFNKGIELNGELNYGKISDEYIGKAKANLFANWNGSVSGNLDVNLQIPKLGDDFPWDLLSSFIEFPISFSGTSADFEISPDNSFIKGSFTYPWPIGTYYYKVDLKKQFPDPDFFKFSNSSQILNSIARKGEKNDFSLQSSELIKDFTINECYSKITIRATGTRISPEFSIKTPSGEFIPYGTQNSKYYFSLLVGDKKTFLNVLTPEIGDYEITVKDEEGVLIDIFTSDCDLQPIKMTKVETNKHIAFVWQNNVGTDCSESLEFYLSNNSKDFAPILYLGKAFRSSGSFVFKKDLPLDCGTYSLFTVHKKEGSDVYNKSYCDEPISIISDIEAPLSASMKKINSDSMLVSWMPVEQEIDYYLIKVINQDGTHRILTQSDKKFDILIGSADFAKCRVYIRTIDKNSKYSCWVEALKI